jgi:hypothetical protein
MLLFLLPGTGDVVESMEQGHIPLQAGQLNMNALFMSEEWG